MMKYLLRALARYYNSRGEIKEEIQEDFLNRLDDEIIDELYAYDSDGALGRWYERRQDELIAEQERMIDDAEWARGCGR